MKIQFLDGVIPVYVEKRAQHFVELRRVTVVRQQCLVLPALNKAYPLPIVYCWYKLRHCGPGVFRMTGALDERRKHHSVLLG